MSWMNGYIHVDSNKIFVVIHIVLVMSIDRSDDSNE